MPQLTRLQLDRVRESLVHRPSDEIGILLVAEKVIQQGRYPKAARRNIEQVIDLFCEVADKKREDVKPPSELVERQIRIYCMIGGGFLGRAGAEQPQGFYIDDRCGRLPYSRKEIYKAVGELNTFASAQGLDTNRLPSMPSFHHCGVF